MVAIWMIFDAMRYILVLSVSLVFASVAAAQEVKQGGAESANWSKLGPAVEGPRGFTLLGKGIRINGSGQYELWVKVVPGNQPAFIKRYDLPKGTEYVVQYATVDCDRRSVSLEKTALYGMQDKVMVGNITSITPSSRKETVRPGSISESVFRFVCVETTSLPLPKSN